MLKWMTGRLLARDFKRCLEYAQDAWSGDEARRACAFLLRRTQSVRRLMPEDQLPLVAAELEAMREALGPRRSRDAQQIAQKVLFEWMSAKQAALLGYIESEKFDSIAAHLDAFIESRLRPQEIRELVGVRSIAPSPADRLFDD